MKITKPKILGIIPARYASSRLPGKMLKEISGKTLIQRTYERAKGAKLLDELVIATDNVIVKEHVEAFGAKAYLTSPECPTGSDRVAELALSTFPEYDHVVNVQGDEPLIKPETIDQLITKHISEPNALMTTAVTPIIHPEMIFSPSSVKCVFDKHGRALFFSRSPLPNPYKNKKDIPYFRHIGIYCFRKEFLKTFQSLEATPLGLIEELEQLKVLEHGYPIYVAIVSDEGVEVNYEEDIAKVEALIG